MKKPQCQTFCGKYYGWISFASNLFNAAFKIGVGVFASSQALVADGFHSLADSLTAIMTIVTLMFSARPPDRSHPYGHGKVEFLSAAFFSLLLLLLALILMGRSIHSMFEASLAPPNFLAIGPAVVSIMVNIAISNYGLCVGRELNSPVIVANAKENKADAFSSIASLVGILGALAGYPLLDPLAALAVSLLIGRMGLEIMREAAAGLMDSSIDKECRVKMRGMVRATPGVQKVTFLKTRRIGQRIWADVGITVPPTATLNEGDRTAREVRNCLMRNYPELQDTVVYLNSGLSSTAGHKLFAKLAWLFRT